MCRKGEAVKLDVAAGCYELSIDGSETAALGEDHAVSAVIEAVRRAAVEGKSLLVSPKACVRVGVTVGDPHDDEGNPCFERHSYGSLSKQANDG